MHPDNAGQIARQEAVIDDLRARAAADRNTIAGLEEQAGLDRSLIKHLQAEGVLGRDKIANLEAALVAARRIGAAIGILMATRKVTEDEAFELLRLASQASHRKLRVIADDVLFAGDLPA